MIRLVSASSVTGLLVLGIVGCGPDAPKVAESIPVKGTVKLDGKPMDAGEVSFSIAGQPGRIATVTNGEFSGNAYPGTNKVEFAHFKEGPPLSTDPKKAPTKVNDLPAKYQFESKVTAEVKAGGPNEFKFDITSK